MIQTIILIILSLPLYSAILGEVKTTHIYPGHITFDKNDSFYKGYSASTKNLGGISKKTPSQVVQKYFQKDQLSPKKLSILIQETDSYLNTIKKSVCIDKFRNKLDSYDECAEPFYHSKSFQKKWKKNKFNIALSFVINELNSLKQNAHNVTKKNINTKSSQQLIEKLFTSLEILQGIRGEELQKGPKSSILQSIGTAGSILSRDSISKSNNHPSNLLKNSNEQMFYSHRELTELVNQGFDISTLDPPDSGIWRKPQKSISKYDTFNYNNEGKKQLRKIFSKSFTEKFLDSDEIIDVEYRGNKLGGGKTVKFDVFIKNSKFKIKFITNKHQSTETLSEGNFLFRHIQASEANVEPVANTLAASIGYTVDPTYFKKKVRLYFPEKIFGKNSFETERLKLIKSLEDRYNKFSNPKSALSNIQEDENGRKFLLIQSVSLEQKSNIETDMNIGFFQRAGMGKSLKREHRAIYAFLALIMDIDLKDDNTKAKLVPYKKDDGQLSYKVMLSNSDMGSSLGTGHPNLYNFNLVRHATDKKIDLNFIRLFSFDNRFTTNLDDAKWMTRRIAQLSLQQIERAFQYAGHTSLVAKYYSLLFAKKRNQLVKALGLNNETFKDDQGEEFTIKLLEEFEGSIQSFEEFFVNGFLTDPDNKLMDKEFESFPRFWGMSYTNFSTNDPQKKLIEKLKKMLKIRAKAILNKNLISQASLSNKGLGYLNRGVFERNIFGLCDGKCFFSGLSVGVNSFIPYRVIINNPNTKSSKPFLILDIYRLGLFLGNGTSDFENKLGINKSPLNVEVGANLFKMKEYIKIKEVNSIDDFFTKRPSIRISKNELFKSIEKKIMDLKEDESFFSREYLGLVGEILARSNTIIPFSSLRFRAQAIGTKSHLLQKKEGHFLLRNESRRSKTFDSTFNLVDMLIRLPILKLSMSKNKFNEDVMKFKKSVDYNFIMECMSNIKSCEQNKSQTRNSHTSVSNTIFNMFWVMRESRVKTKGYSYFQDFFKQEQSKEKYYIFKINSSRLRKLVQSKKEIQSTAHINQDRNISISIQADYFKPAATRKHLSLLLEEYRHLLPDDILNLDISQTKYYFGNLSSKIDIVIKPKALEKLFDESFLENSFCKSYAKFKKINFNKNCLNSKQRNIVSFIKKYKSAKNSFWKLKNINIEHARYRNLKKLAKFFYDKNAKLNITKFLISIISPKYFKRDVSIVSTLSAFPGDIDEIKESKLRKGKASKFKLINAQLAGDTLIDAITPFLYNNLNIRDL